jgi:ribose 5-phosphate isomerase A
MHDPDLLPLVKAKQAAGEAAAELIEDGMLIGLGTGSTAAYFMEALAIRCQKGLKIWALPTSLRSLHQAQKLKIPLLDTNKATQLDLDVDGADEIDHKKNMIKGGGGALLREKIVAQSSREMIVVVDETKLVDHIGSFPVPIEIASFAYQTTVKRLEEKGYRGKLRFTRENQLYLTDNGGYIFDINFNHPILNPAEEDMKLRRIAGVVETGLFYQTAGRVIVGYSDGYAKILR